MKIKTPTYLSTFSIFPNQVNNTEQDQFEDSTTLGDAQSTSLNSSLSSSGPAPQVPASSPPQSAGPEKAKEPVVESVSEVTAPVSSEANEAQAPETKDTTVRRNVLGVTFILFISQPFSIMSNVHGQY